MIKDRIQKEAALQYIVSKGWFPQLELVVQTSHSASDKNFDITDIDVFGAAPDDFCAYQRILFDCKSGRRESSVTRALWMKGLLEYLGGSRGICLVNDDKNIPLDHRETSSKLNVSIMTLYEFKSYTQLQLRPLEQKAAI